MDGTQQPGAHKAAIGFRLLACITPETAAGPCTTANLPRKNRSMCSNARMVGASRLHGNASLLSCRPSPPHRPCLLAPVCTCCCHDCRSDQQRSGQQRGEGEEAGSVAAAQRDWCQAQRWAAMDEDVRAGHEAAPGAVRGPEGLPHGEGRPAPIPEPVPVGECSCRTVAFLPFPGSSDLSLADRSTPTRSKSSSST